MTTHEALMIMIDNEPAIAYTLILDRFTDTPHIRDTYAWIADGNAIKLIRCLVDDGFIMA